MLFKNHQSIILVYCYALNILLYLLLFSFGKAHFCSPSTSGATLGTIKNSCTIFRRNPITKIEACTVKFFSTISVIILSPSTSGIILDKRTIPVEDIGDECQYNVLRKTYKKFARSTRTCASSILSKHTRPFSHTFLLSYDEVFTRLLQHLCFSSIII